MTILISQPKNMVLLLRKHFKSDFEKLKERPA
jgi:hypothetical protein